MQFLFILRLLDMLVIMITKKLSILTDEGKKIVSAYEFPLYLFDSRFNCFQPFTKNFNLAQNPIHSDYIGIYLDDGLIIGSINRKEVLDETLDESTQFRLIEEKLKPLLFTTFERLQTILNEKRECFERSFADLSA